MCVGVRVRSRSTVQLGFSRRPLEQMSRVTKPNVTPAFKWVSIGHKSEDKWFEQFTEWA